MRGGQYFPYKSNEMTWDCCKLYKYLGLKETYIRKQKKN